MIIAYFMLFNKDIVDKKNHSYKKYHFSWGVINKTPKEIVKYG